MKDIGETFREKRESIGITVKEVSNDLEVTEAQLENLEDGNINAFKDIFFLKELIKKYCTYLDLDDEEILNEFNNYIFDFTSKIPIKELEEKVKEIQKEEKETKQIHSPYTENNIIKNKATTTIILVLIGIVVVIFLIILIFLFKGSV